MSSVQRGLLNVWQPTLQFVRFRKVNIQKPFPPHFERAKIEHICKPIFPKSRRSDPTVPTHEICRVHEKYFQRRTNKVNPYVSIIAKETLNYFNHSKLIAFFQKNPMDNDEIYEARLLLKRLGMKMKLHGKEIMTEAVTSTKYEAILKFYNSHTAVAFGPDPDVAAFMKSLKKMNKLTLLGAVVDDRLMSRSELEFYGSLPDIQAVRAGLVSVLNSAAQGVVHSLNHHQSQLVQHLNSHVEISNKNEGG